MSLFRYTRNGELLGDGFVPVYESNLVPVVGFHSNGESVRVNFGLVPFAYEVSSLRALLDTGAAPVTVTGLPKG